MVLLCGGTGNLGRRIAERICSRGLPMTALVRPDSNARHLDEAGARVVRGDLREPESLRAALSGVETVITTANAIGRIMAGERRLSIRDVDEVGNANLITAAEQVGVGRLVFLSGIGFEQAAPLAPFAAAKFATERRLLSSSVRAVILRPDMFQEIWLSPAVKFDWFQGRVTIFGRGDAKAAYVAMDDAAEAAVLLALSNNPPPITQFGGPEAITRNELVSAFERMTGRRIRTRRVPRAALRIGARVLRAPRPELASLMGMALTADLTDCTWTDEPLRHLGIKPRPVRDYIAALTGSRDSA
jgi:nucleoside-diphosphate-sugar epimerase